MIKKIEFSILFFFLVLICYSIFSYSLTDPNLVITSWQPYWQFQQLIWQKLFHNQLALTTSYAVLVSLLVLTYGQIIKHVDKITLKKMILLFVVLLLPLLFSYNALSHDVFNYMFNAKMILVYNANPHHQVALDFPPYGYGWTVLSLLPYAMGLGKFVTTWLAFRGFAVLSIALLLGAIVKTAQLMRIKLSNSQLALLFFNPLLLLEVVSNMHNDLWMIAPAVMSLGILSRKDDQNIWSKIAISGVLLGLSISIKLATVVLLPLWLVLVIKNTAFMSKLDKQSYQLFSIISNFWPGLASLGLFIPLLTQRSKQFLPWYLLWVMAWWPLMQTVKKYPKLSYWQNIWKIVILILSVTVIYRYLPWLWQGDFSGQVEWQQKMITWIPFLFAIIGVPLYEKLKK